MHVSEVTTSFQIVYLHHLMAFLHSPCVINAVCDSGHMKVSAVCLPVKENELVSGRDLSKKKKILLALFPAEP